MRAIVMSYRLGMPDGVSVEAAKWASALRRLGWQVTTAAGEGEADVVIPNFGLESRQAPAPEAVERLLADADLVVVENILSLPMKPATGRILAPLLRGRPALLHHHDMAWQRGSYRDIAGFPPDDPCWRHITINKATQRDLIGRGIAATVIPNSIGYPIEPGRRELARRSLGVAPDQVLVLQPTRAIPRKNIPAGLRLAAAVEGTYWLTGPAEDGYDECLRRLIAAHRGPVRRGLSERLTIADAYAAADVVAFPSLLEGFGNPVIESAAYRRPLAVAQYPVLDELRQYGFRWFHHEDHEGIRTFLRDPDPELLEQNERIVRDEFSSFRLDRVLAREIAALGLGASRTDSSASCHE